MKVQARAQFLLHSPYKVRRVLDLVRGLPVEEARQVLGFANRGAAHPVRKVLESAVANARHNHALDAEELFVVSAFADEGPVLKRMRPRARGRATRILRRTSHVTVVVGDQRGEGEEG
jgi:large subunit ribosomal protein L22